MADSIAVDNLMSVLAWSAEPHGSEWLHRQARHFLHEEFLQVAHSQVLLELSRDHMVQLVQSDFLQVTLNTCSTGSNSFTKSTNR